jgi:hypothetical protein
MWDFSLDAVLNPALNPVRTGGIDVNGGDARALQRGGMISDDGELESDYRADKQVLRNVSSFLVFGMSICGVNESLICKPVS